MPSSVACWSPGSRYRASGSPPDQPAEGHEREQAERELGA